jgi:hypothetical protein
MNIPFAIPAAAVTLAVTTTTGSVALAGTGSALRVCNVGGAECFLAAGSSTVTATTASMSVPAGAIETFTIPITATHVAAITASGTTTLRLARGEGV